MKPSQKKKSKFHIIRLGAVLAPVLVLTFAILTGCARNTVPISRTGFYFDTVIQITLYDTEDETILDGCFALAEKYENLLSVTKEGSDIWKVNHGGGDTVIVSRETADLLLTALDYSVMSEGKIDPAIRPVSKLWGFGTDDDLHVPEESDIAEALSHVSGQKIQTGCGDTPEIAASGCSTICLNDPKAAIDLGFIAKGYIADQIKEYLLSENVHSACISLGGNILAIGEKPDGSPFRIGIQEPFAAQGTTLDTVEIKDTSVVTSGIYERCFYENGVLYHHVLDTATGYPVDNELAGVTVICKSSVKADALSTSCLCMGLEKGRQYLDKWPDVAYLLITKDGTQYRSENFPR